MCGRYALYTLDQLVIDFVGALFPPQLRPRYNIAPTQPVLALMNETPQRFEHLYWGLVPAWAKDPKIGSRMINARSETLADKPAFRNAYRRRRCLIPADGFYEWRRDGKVRTPFFIRMKSHRPFMMAGLWEWWSDDGGNELRSCTIVTGPANTVVSPIHDRMPVIVPPQGYAAWLDPAEVPPPALDPLLASCPPEAMEAFEVSREVNSSGAPFRRPEPVLSRPLFPLQ